MSNESDKSSVSDPERYCEAFLKENGLMRPCPVITVIRQSNNIEHFQSTLYVAETIKIHSVLSCELRVNKTLSSVGVDANIVKIIVIVRDSI